MKEIDFSQPSGAIISRCKIYRYALWRTWDVTLSRVMFICLNPSTADGKVDDPTLLRCMDFAKQWGFGGMQTGNLFAYRSTDPTMLKQVKNPIGPENDKWLHFLSHHAELVIAGWGNDGAFLERDQLVFQNHPDLHCLKLNKSGQPAHPLYLKRSLKPFPMSKSIKAKPSVPVISNDVASRFAEYPKSIQKKSVCLRELIYQIASDDPQIGKIEETLKWGQPAYLTSQSGSGTTIRIDWRETQPQELVMFLNCRTSLVDTYRSIFPDIFRYEGSRALVIGKADRIDRGEKKEALSHCIRMALRYHLDK